MVTGRQIYERAIALVDEIDPDSGEVSIDTTEDYLARAPYLLTILQTELIRYTTTRKKVEIVSDGTSTGWVKVDLPDDVFSIDDVVTESHGRYCKDPVWRTEQNGNVTELYHAGQFNGVIRVIYKAIPAPVTDLDEELEIDAVTANLMAYGLAEAFINVEQNEFLQRIFKQKYDEQKATVLASKPHGMTRVIDVYGGI